MSGRVWPWQLIDGEIVSPVGGSAVGQSCAAATLPCPASEGRSLPEEKRILSGLTLGKVQGAMFWAGVKAAEYVELAERDLREGVEHEDDAIEWLYLRGLKEDVEHHKSWGSVEVEDQALKGLFGHIESCLICQHVKEGLGLVESPEFYFEQAMSDLRAAS